MFASRVNGAGDPIVGLRTCAGPNDELRCRSGTAVPLFVTGQLVFTVSATFPLPLLFEVSRSL